MAHTLEDSVRGYNRAQEALQNEREGTRSRSVLQQLADLFLKRINEYKEGQTIH